MKKEALQAAAEAYAANQKMGLVLATPGTFTTTEDGHLPIFAFFTFEGAEGEELVGAVMSATTAEVFNYGMESDFTSFEVVSHLAGGGCGELVDGCGLNAAQFIAVWEAACATINAAEMAADDLRS